MRLSPRQTEIVSLVAEGFSGKEIARTLRMSPKTVEAHMQRMFDKYGVRSRAGSWRNGSPPTRREATDDRSSVLRQQACQRLVGTVPAPCPAHPGTPFLAQRACRFGVEE